MFSFRSFRIESLSTDELASLEIYCVEGTCCGLKRMNSTILETCLKIFELQTFHQFPQHAWEHRCLVCLSTQYLQVRRTQLHELGIDVWHCVEDIWNGYCIGYMQVITNQGNRAFQMFGGFKKLLEEPHLETHMNQISHSLCSRTLCWGPPLTHSSYKFSDLYILPWVRGNRLLHFQQTLHWLMFLNAQLYVQFYFFLNVQSLVYICNIGLVKIYNIFRLEVTQRYLKFCKVTTDNFLLQFGSCRFHIVTNAFS